MPGCASAWAAISPGGGQVEYVLGEWNGEERAALPDRLKVFVDAIRSFTAVGTQLTMNFLHFRFFLCLWVKFRLYCVLSTVR